MSLASCKTDGGGGSSESKGGSTDGSGGSTPDTGGGGGQHLIQARVRVQALPKF